MLFLGEDSRVVNRWVLRPAEDVENQWKQRSIRICSNPGELHKQIHRALGVKNDPQLTDSGINQARQNASGEAPGAGPKTMSSAPYLMAQGQNKYARR